MSFRGGILRVESESLTVTMRFYHERLRPSCRRRGQHPRAM